MTVYLARRGYAYSPTTIHKYMNTELGLRSIVRPKKPDHQQGKAHKIFENKINQDFTADKINQKWCTDFTYLFLTDHEVRYNCTIIDLHDRSVIASITDRHICLCQVRNKKILVFSIFSNSCSYTISYSFGEKYPQ